MQLKRVPAEDRMWLMAELSDLLKENTADGVPDTVLLPFGEGNQQAHIAEDNLPREPALLIHTSGSSGVAKTVTLTVQAIRASALATNEALGGAGQWLVALPTHLISGLQMLTRSVLAETEPVFYDGSFKPKSFLERARTLTHERRYTSLVPVQLARLLEYVEEDPQALAIAQRFDAILVGGQATPLELRQRAYELGVKIVRTYGMTETAGGCVYDGVEIGDAAVRIRDGEVQLSGNMLATEYVGNPELTAAKFINENGTVWFRTGDSGILRGGMLEITGRLDRVIVSGGVNVSLDEVERVAGELPDFASCIAVSVPDEEWGTRVVLLAENGTITEELATLLRDRLGSAAIPKRVVRVKEVPRLAGGKPDVQTARALVLQELKREGDVK